MHEILCCSCSLLAGPTKVDRFCRCDGGEKALGLCPDRVGDVNSILNSEVEIFCDAIGGVGVPQNASAETRIRGRIGVILHGTKLPKPDTFPVF